MKIWLLSLLSPFGKGGWRGIIGKYIVDFYCPRANLVIELDGGQHYSETGEAKDKVRDDALADMGIKVLRFSDRDVFENIGGVMEGMRGKKAEMAPSIARRA